MTLSELVSKALHATSGVAGVQTNGEAFHISISDDGPHFLVCGQTKSGKSVFLNALLISIILHNTPDTLQIIWVDPKKVEATAYVGLPYCPIDPVTNMGDAYGLLAYYVHVMDERYKALEQVGVKNLDEFNEWVLAYPDKAAELGLSAMPFVLLVIDEYADLKATNPEVDDLNIRLAQKARAAGIHLIIATQRPSAEVTPPLLRSNIPGRVGLKVDNSATSQIAINDVGCESLRGYGDAWIINGITGDKTRVQGAYISNAEIDAIFAHLRDKYPAPEFFDYKAAVVELGLAQWETEYTEDVPWSERHVKKPGRGRLRM